MDEASVSTSIDNSLHQYYYVIKSNTKIITLTEEFQNAIEKSLKGRTDTNNCYIKLYWNNSTSNRKIQPTIN